MKRIIIALTISLVIIGFMTPIAWVFAIVTSITAIGVSPSVRFTGSKRRTGGLLGGVWNQMMIDTTMIDCPCCRAKIKKGIPECAHCGECISLSRKPLK